MDVRLFCLLCLQVTASATSWSLVQMRPSSCVCVCVCVCVCLIACDLEISTVRLSRLELDCHATRGGGVVGNENNQLLLHWKRFQHNSQIYVYLHKILEYAVAKLVEALPYKPECRRFKSRWGHTHFLLGRILPAALYPGRSTQR